MNVQGLPNPTSIRAATTVFDRLLATVFLAAFLATFFAALLAVFLVAFCMCYFRIYVNKVAELAGCAGPSVLKNVFDTNFASDGKIVSHFFW